VSADMSSITFQLITCLKSKISKKKIAEYL